MNIGIIFGGKSVEHEISILTMMDCYKKINGNKYLIYVSRDLNYYLVDLKIINRYNNADKYYKKITFINGGIKKFLKKIKIDFMFIMMHGINGEDGSAYSLCNMHNIKCIGSNNIISAISMRKDYFKKICPFKTLDFKYVDYDSKIKYPSIIKPADLGSSIGINVVYNDLEFKKALDEAFLYSKVVIAEDYLENVREFNCAVCYEHVSNVFEVSDGFLTFDKKYKEEKTVNIIDSNLSELIKEHSRKIYDLGFSGVIRIDYLYKDDVLYVNEVNTIPGVLSNNMFDFNIFDYMIKKTLIDYQNDVNYFIKTDILELNPKK